MPFRTDLTLEAAENAAPLTAEDCTVRAQTVDGVQITAHTLHTPHAAAVYGKPQGKYVTLELPPLSDDETRLREGAALLAAELQTMLPEGHGTVLVVGLGNRAITPDALGPRTADYTLATRHIQGEFARSVGLGDLRPTAVLSPGVLGQTGAESSEIVRGVCDRISPAAVICIDALTARSIRRLGCTIQLTDTGIAPGAGVGNHRAPLNRDTLGVPVVSIGVPTVVDAAVIAGECVGQSEITLPPAARNLIVTPKEIDLVIHRAAKLIAAGLHLTLHPAYEPFQLISLATG